MPEMWTIPPCALWPSIMSTTLVSLTLCPPPWTWEMFEMHKDRPWPFQWIRNQTLACSKSISSLKWLEAEPNGELKIFFFNLNGVNSDPNSSYQGSPLLHINPTVVMRHYLCRWSYISVCYWRRLHPPPDLNLYLDIEGQHCRSVRLWSLSFLKHAVESYLLPDTEGGGGQIPGTQTISGDSTRAVSPHRPISKPVTMSNWETLLASAYSKSHIPLKFQMVCWEKEVRVNNGRKKTISVCVELEPVVMRSTLTEQI